MIPDKYILDIPKNGLKLEFLDETAQSKLFTIPYSTKQNFSISLEIDKLVTKKVQSITENVVAFLWLHHYGPAMRAFKKLLKPSFAFLQSER